MRAGCERIAMAATDMLAQNRVNIIVIHVLLEFHCGVVQKIALNE